MEKIYATSPETMSFSGPFLLKTLTPQKAILIKNRSYWDQSKVKLMKAVLNVEVDKQKQQELYRSELTSMVELDGKERKNKKELIKVLKSVSDFLEMNEKDEIFQNERIRKAIRLQINSKKIKQKFPNSFVSARGVIPPMSKSNKFIDVQPSEAKSKVLLAKGYQELGIKQLHDLKLLTYNDDRSIILAEQVKEQLNKIGIKVTIKKLAPSKKSQAESEGNFDLSISEWSLKYPNALEVLSLWESNADTNISGFADHHYDALIQQASLEANPAKREQLLQQAQRYLIVDKAAVVPLVYVNDCRLQKSYVKNVVYHPFGADYSLKWATYHPPKQIEATK